MTDQDYQKLPKDQQWEYATLTLNRTAGLFGVLGASQSMIWVSTLEDESEISFEREISQILCWAGRAGWELVSSTTATTLRGGNTTESGVILMFKQHVATSEEQSIAQLIDPSALLKRAIRYLEQGNPAMAIRVANRGLSFSPRDTDLLYLARGRSYLTMGDEQQALDDFSRALESNQQCGEAWLERAHILLRRKDWDNAVNDYHQALRLIRDDYNGPNSQLIREIRYRRGLALKEMGKPKEAVKDLKEYLNRAHNEPEKQAEVEALIRELERRK